MAGPNPRRARDAGRREKWDRRFLAMAQLVSTWSKDPRTKVGAIIVRPDNIIVATGYNGLPSKMPDDPAILHDRERKLKHILHAERNAMIFAIKAHVDLDNCTIYVWPMLPCHDCSLMLIQSGITRFVAPKPGRDRAEHWGESMDLTKDIARACRIIVREYA